MTGRQRKIRKEGKRLVLGRKNMKGKINHKFKGHREGSKESKEDLQLELEAVAATGEEVKEDLWDKTVRGLIGSQLRFDGGHPWRVLSGGLMSNVAAGLERLE